MLTVISNSKEKCIYTPFETGTLAIYKKNTPVQICMCYNNVKKEDNEMSYICVYYDDNGVYVASDSLNVILNEKYEIVEEKKIQKIFHKDNILIANCGLTTIPDDEGIIEISELIKTNKINEEELVFDIQNRLKTAPKIKDAVEIIFIQYYEKSGFNGTINITAHSITAEKIESKIISKYQIAIWGKRSNLLANKKYDSFSEDIKEDVINAMKKNVFYNIDTFVDTPIQLWKMNNKGLVQNLSEAPFNKEE